MLRTIVLAVLLVTTNCVNAEAEGIDTSAPLWIALKNNTLAEERMATEVRQLARKHYLAPWIVTPRILIDENSIPHSHPVLTIHTRHIGEPLNLLATFLHEQFHWFVDDHRPTELKKAMTEMEELYPEVPSRSEGGARNDESTYGHLVVCDLELQALTALVGSDLARKTLTETTHYEWIYEKVLSDPRVREIVLRNGMDVRQSAH